MPFQTDLFLSDTFLWHQSTVKTFFMFIHFFFYNYFLQPNSGKNIKTAPFYIPEFSPWPSRLNRKMIYKGVHYRQVKDFFKLFFCLITRFLYTFYGCLSPIACKTLCSIYCVFQNKYCWTFFFGSWWFMSHCRFWFILLMLFKMKLHPVSHHSCDCPKAYRFVSVVGAQKAVEFKLALLNDGVLGPDEN